MKRMTALCLGLIVSASALAIEIPQPAPIKIVEWLPGTTIKIGNGINAAYRVTTQANQTSEVWIHTDCQTFKKTLLFINTQPGKGLRVYSTDSVDRYKSGTPFEPNADSPFNTEPELNLCKQNIPESKWAGITSWDQPGEKLFVDVSNSLREGAILKARLATDYDKVHHDVKYGAPYSVKIQDVMFNCEKAESMAFTTFLLDNQSFVSDSAFANDTVFSAISPDMIGVAKELCATTNLTSYKGNGTLTWRKKETADDGLIRPDFEHNIPTALNHFALPADVTSFIKKTFSNPQQIPTFRTLRYSQNGPEQDEIGLMARIDAQPDGTTLTIVKMKFADVVFYSQYQRLFNLVDIKKWETMSEAPWVSKTLHNSIILPIQTGKVYASQSQIENRDKPGKDKRLSQSCVASKEWRNSSDLNPNFPGRYLVLMCKQDLGDGREASSDYAYFEALGIFIRIGFQDHGQTKRFTFSDVEVVR